MMIKIPGNEEVEKIELPNGEYVRIMYIQSEDEWAMPEQKYSAPFRLIELYDKKVPFSELEEATLLGSKVEKNPYYNPNLVMAVFENLGENEIKFK